MAEFREVDLQSEHRQQQFDYFNQLPSPLFALSFEVDLTALFEHTDQVDIPTFPLCLYAVGYAVHQVAPFRRRIVKGKVIEYSQVKLSFTTLNTWQQVNFCQVPWLPDIASFAKEVESAQQQAHQASTLNVIDPQATDYVFCSCVPWLKLSSVQVPVRMTHDSIPQFVWGKLDSREQQVKLLLSVQAHHGLIDGYHVGLLARKLSKLRIR